NSGAIDCGARSIPPARTGAAVVSRAPMPVMILFMISSQKQAHSEPLLPACGRGRGCVNHPHILTRRPVWYHVMFRVIAATFPDAGARGRDYDDFCAVSAKTVS